MPELASKRPRTPGRSLWTTLGPGIVILGSVIGSGELIGTPVQAAKFGFILLWAVLLACLLRFFLQVEIGRHCLVHRRTTIEALNTCPGPQWRGTSWIALLYMALYSLLLLPSVGMIGALAGLCHSLMPLANSQDASVSIWAVLIVVATWAALAGGVYKQLERLVIVLVATFSVTTIGALVLLQWTPYSFSWAQILSGLTFSLGENRAAAAYAVVAFIGGLGVTANELFMYPYWIEEKGYGAELDRQRDIAWTTTAKRWIRSVWIDVTIATLLTTVVTIAFFLLGCTILHRQAIVPQGLDVVQQIGQVYVETYGLWSLRFFNAGAFCTLASTLIVTVAASGRMVSDLLGSLGLIDRRNPVVARRVHQIAQPIWLILLLIAYFVANALAFSPATLVIFGHFLSGGFAMPLILFGICWMAFHTDIRVRMKPATAALLVITSVVILACSLLGVADHLGWLK